MPLPCRQAEILMLRLSVQIPIWGLRTFRAIERSTACIEAAAASANA